MFGLLGRLWNAYFRPCYPPGTPSSSLEEHDRAVQQIAARVKEFHEQGQPFRINHGSTNSTRRSAVGRDPKKVVDTSGLNHVVKVDVEKQVALVEPNVSMDRLVEATLEFGLVPPVVMEFPGITAGGGYNGTSGESSSFKHGFFEQTINSVEMVLADGQTVIASEKEHSDLFRGAAGAVGTFGVTTLIELQLRKAMKFVETTYHPVGNVKEAVTLMKDFTSRPDEFDFIDGIMYSPMAGAVITGRMTDEPSAAGNKIQRFSAPWDPWYYMHVAKRIALNPAHISPIYPAIQSLTIASKPQTDVIPLTEYLFRYDRGGFWVGRSTFIYFFWVPFNRFTRWFLDDFLHTRMLYHALHGSGNSDYMMVQDLALPWDTAENFIEKMNETVRIWPLWLCPLKGGSRKTMHPHLQQRDQDDGMLNIGVWGAPSEKYHYRGGSMDANLDVEAALREMGGMKWLYAKVYSSQTDFWKQFDKDWYDKLRKKYNAESLPDVFDKVAGGEKHKPNESTLLGANWPFAGFKGIRRAIQSGDYLQARNPAWWYWGPRK